MKKSLVAGVSALVLSFVALTGCTTNGGSNKPNQTTTETETNTNTGTKTETSNPTETQTEVQTETQPGSTETTPVETPIATVAEINQLDTYVTDKKVSVKHGQKVKVVNVEVLASYEHYMYVHQVIANDDNMVTITEIALEVRNDNVDFREYTTSCLINVEGVIDTYHDRFIMKDATVEVVKENPTGEPKNLFINGGFDRSSTIFATRFFNGIGTIATLQVAEDVGVITKEGKSIKCVFPGEDLTVSDENTNLFEFIIPAGLNQYELDFINANRYGNLTVGQCFETLAALTYDDGIWNFTYLPYIGSNPDYIGGRARTPIAFKSFEDLKSQYLPDLINEENIASFPNLSTTDTATSKSLVYNYLPNDIDFTAEGEYSLYISLNSYDLDSAVEQINAQLKAQNFYGGNESVDESGVIKSYIFVSDTSAEPEYTVSVENAAGVVAGVEIKVKSSLVKPEQELFDSKDFADGFEGIKKVLNKSVDKVSRRHSVLLPQYDGFASNMPDLRPAMTKVGLTPANVVLDRRNETVYGNDQFLPIIQERLMFNFESDLKPTIIEDGDEITYDLPAEILTKYFMLVKEASFILKDNGFEYTNNELLYQLGPNGEKEPVFGYFNRESNEMIMFDIRFPRFDKAKNEWKGNWAFAVFDEIIHDAISFRLTPAPNDEPLYKIPETFQAFFQHQSGAKGEFVLPEFDAAEYIVGTEKNNDKVVMVIMFIPYAEDPIASYTETLKAAGFTVTSEVIEVPSVGDKPASSYTLYTATSETSDVVIEFALSGKTLEISATKKSA